MKIYKDRIEFIGQTHQINAFYTDIIKIHKKRNILFFIRQIINGIKIERKK